MPEQPSDDVQVAPELKEDFDRWQAIMRGNEKIERELISRKVGVDPLMFAFKRLDAVTNELLGDPRVDRRRLDFEIRFCEDIRLLLTELKLRP